MEAPFQNLVTPYTELHPDRCALLVIDVQNDYADPGGAYPIAGIETVMPELVKVIEIFRAAERPVVHVVRLYKEDGSNVDLCRRWQVERGELRAIVPGTWGSQLVAATNHTGADLEAERLLAGEVQELTPIEFVIFKPRFGAFHDTGLHDFLSARGIDSVVIAGITFPNCVLAAQLGATDRDYRVGLIPSACTQVDDAGLAAMQNKGVRLMTVEDLRGFLQPS
jgi:nicotinamidase-related amidase